MSAKLLQKQFRSLIPSMPQKDLKKLFQSFKQSIDDQIYYGCKEMSYMCYEGVLTMKGKKASGYGRTEQEAYCNVIKNLLQVLIEEDDMIFVLKHCIKKNNEIQTDTANKQNYPRKSLTIKPSLTSLATGQNNQNRRSKAYLKPVNIDSLNVSLHKTVTNKSQIELQLQGAKIYITQLELKLKTLEQQNKFLKRIQIQSTSTSNFSSSIAPSSNNYVHVSSEYDLNKFSIDPKHTKSHYSQNQKIQQKLNSSVQQLMRKIQPEYKEFNDKKKIVPKLKLQILPNFHGKSTKSINHSFLASQQAFGK